MLMKYLPGLDASKISDSEFIMRVAHLQRIREMEKAELIKKLMR